MSFLDVVVTQILGSPAITFGLVALLGLLLLRKSASEIMAGCFKTMLGYVIFMGGAGLVTAALDPLSKMIRAGLGVEGVVPLYWPAFSQTMAEFGSQVALVFVMGFALNVALARFTPLRFLALSVHQQMFWSGFVVIALDAAGMSGLPLLLVGAVISGLYFWLMTAIAYVFMKDSMTDKHAIFVPSAVGILVAALCGRLLPGKGRSTEGLTVPKGLGWAKDNIIAVTVTMMLVYFAFAFVVGIPFVTELAGGQWWPVYFLLISLQFGGALAIILYGIKMLVGEIVPAFTGVSQRLLPNAKLGLESPTVFPYAGTAVLLGFLCHLAGSVIATIVQAAMGFSPLVVPGVQVNFFEGAMVGVYANAMGGVRNVVLSNLVVGFLLAFGVAWVYPHTGILATAGVAYETIDYNTVGLVLVKVLELFR